MFGYPINWHKKRKINEQWILPPFYPIFLLLGFVYNNCIKIEILGEVSHGGLCDYVCS